MYLPVDILTQMSHWNLIKNKMIRAFSKEMVSQFSKVDITYPDSQSIIKRILRKSLIEPRGKTFFEGRHLNKYIIVEPAISIEDIEKWKIIE